MKKLLKDLFNRIDANAVQPSKTLLKTAHAQISTPKKMFNTLRADVIASSTGFINHLRSSVTTQPTRYETRNVQTSRRTMEKYQGRVCENGTYQIVLTKEKSTRGGIKFSETIVAANLPYPLMRETLCDLEIDLRDRFIDFKREVATQYAPFESSRAIDEFNGIRLPEDHYTRYPVNSPELPSNKKILTRFLGR